MKSLKKDPVHGVDGRWSWITAGLCSWALFLAMSSICAMGVLYVGIIDTFGATREEASWPVTLPDSLLNLAGPLMGVLCRWFSCRTVLLACSFLTGIGISICFFARGVLFLSLMFGALHGLTLAGIFVSVNSILPQHFDKSRNAAFSLLMTVAGLNGFIVTPLVQFFYSTYGSRGAFLLLGAVLFNVFPAAISIRSPPWGTEIRKFNLKSSKLFFHRSSKVIPATDVLYLSNGKSIGAEYRFNIVDEGSNYQGRVLLAEKNHTSENNSPPNLPYTVEDETLEFERKTLKISSWKTVAKQFLTASFCIDSLTITALVISATTFILVSVDLAIDRGVTASRVFYVQYAYFIADIIFRALIGFIIDRKILSLEAAMFAGFFIQAIGFEILAWAVALPTMMMCAVLIGMSTGFRIPLQAPILIDDFGVELLPVMMGGANFFLGIMNVARPALIGYCRDHLGNYDMLLHIVAAVNIVVACVWILRLLVRRQKRAKEVNAARHGQRNGNAGGQ
ncbi:unnamed protein product, partial [Ixodes hexagonus]